MSVKLFTLRVQAIVEKTAKNKWGEATFAALRVDDLTSFIMQNVAKNMV